jgi:hypothetical protein
MTTFIRPLVLFGLFVILLMTSCVTEKEITSAPLNRYVKEGVYRNNLKGYEFKWPSAAEWKYMNYPEFDASFNHVEGSAQVFIIGINQLVRKDFPEGFVDWIMERMQAQTVKITSNEKITSGSLDGFQIALDCQFTVLTHENFGVDRKVLVYAFRNGKKWVACIYLAPEDSFEKFQADVKPIVDNISIFKE